MRRALMALSMANPKVMAQAAVTKGGGVAGYDVPAYYGDSAEGQG